MNTPIQSTPLRCTHPTALTAGSAPADQVSSEDLVVSFVGKFHKLWLTLSLSLVLFGISSLQAATFTGVYGSGSDVAFVTFNFPSVGPLRYQVNFDFSASDPFDSFDAFTEIAAGDSLFDFSVTDFALNPGDPPNYFLDFISYNGIRVENNSSPPFTPFIKQWAAGGQSGFPTPVDIADDDWVLGSGLSFRYFENGSNEIWTLSNVFDDSDKPSTSLIVPLSSQAIPEPSSIGLLTLAFISLTRLRRRKIA